MSIHPDVPVYSDITTWNQKTQISAIDPNTIPATPPHSHLQRSATENMSWDTESPHVTGANAWDAPSDIPHTDNDAALAADMQAAEFSGGLAERVGGHFGDETRERAPRRPRMYGMCSHLTLLPFFCAVLVLRGGVLVVI